MDYIYTDGACINNGKRNAKSSIGIYFGENDSRNVSKTISGKQTNNTAELSAILYVYPIIKKDLAFGKEFVIVSDSEYAIKCATTYGEKCAKKDWNVDIPNKELVKEVYETYLHKNVTFMHIRSHTGKMDKHSIGNENADRLANMALGVDIDKPKKIYLNVPYEKKEEIKALNGKWDPIKKKWYIMTDHPNKEDIILQYS